MDKTKLNLANALNNKIEALEQKRIDNKKCFDVLSNDFNNGKKTVIYYSEKDTVTIHLEDLLKTMECVLTHLDNQIESVKQKFYQL